MAIKTGTHGTMWAGRRGVLAGVIVVVVALSGAAGASARSSVAWAGYQANHDTFRSIQASWKVPFTTCPSRLGGSGESYSLVGLGSQADSIIGISVREGCAGTVPGFDTGYVFDQGASLVQLPLDQGDHVSAKVLYRSGFYYLSFIDHTHADSTWYQRIRCTKRFGTPCNRTGAGVFHGTFMPPLVGVLANFGRLTFHQIAVTDQRGHRGSLAQNRFWTHTRFDLFNPNTDFALGPQATASRLSQSGSRFSVSWRHY